MHLLSLSGKMMLQLSCYHVLIFHSVYFSRNFGDYFSNGSYMMLDTSEHGSGRSRSDSGSSRDVELARFQRMAQSMTSYPTPGSNNSTGSIQR